MTMKPVQMATVTTAAAMPTARGDEGMGRLSRRGQRLAGNAPYTCLIRFESARNMSMKLWNSYRIRIEKRPFAGPPFFLASRIGAGQCGRDTGAGPKGCPPGPARKSSGPAAGCCPTPGLLQSHTPPGKAAASRANWPSLKRPP